LCNGRFVPLGDENCIVVDDDSVVKTRPAANRVEDPVAQWRARWQSASGSGPPPDPGRPVNRKFWVVPCLALVLLCVVLALAAQAQERWGPPGTPWGDNVYGVAITNDSDQAIRARECKATCRRFRDTETIKPGKTVSWGYSYPDRVTSWFLLERSDHSVLGCLSTALAPGSRTTRVAVSQVIACPEAVLPSPTAGP
jgi:hypothetical protein